MDSKVIFHLKLIIHVPGSASKWDNFLVALVTRIDDKKTKRVLYNVLCGAQLMSNFFYV